MAWLVAFGSPVARRTDAVRFLAFFLLCGVAGALFYVLVNGPILAIVVGASGAISGLMGGAMRFFFRAFARLHPSGGFPSFSVAFIGVASALACLLELDALITALMAIYVVIGALPIIGAVTALRRRGGIVRPFSMWWYPCRAWWPRRDGSSSW